MRLRCPLLPKRLHWIHDCVVRTYAWMEMLWEIHADVEEAPVQPLLNPRSLKIEGKSNLLFFNLCSQSFGPFLWLKKNNKKQNKKHVKPVDEWKN